MARKKRDAQGVTPRRGRITERTLYPFLMRIISSMGGGSVSEVQHNSQPDIEFDLGGHRWLLSVKIGETAEIVKDAFLQYWRHIEESGIQFGLIVFFPEEIRRVPPEERALEAVINSQSVSAIINADSIREEVKQTFPQVMSLLLQEVLLKIQQRQVTYYPLPLVITMLQQQVAEMMDKIKLEEEDLLHIITNKKLLKDIGHVAPEHAKDVARFLASYIYLSQILFFRLLSVARSELCEFRNMPKRVTKTWLRRAFKRIRDINYRAIYEIDILDAIDSRYLVDTFELIWRLQIENVRYELPGRMFHELMPPQIRKMLAAFYTRPLAAELLAKLTISQSGQTVFDPACGSGTILTAAYRRKAELWQAEGKAGNPHERFCEQDIYGADIMPFAVHLTSANLSAMEPAISVELTQIIRGDSLRLIPNRYPPGMQIDLFPSTATAQTAKGDELMVHLDQMDVVLMNPPFTKVERGIRRFVDMQRFAPRCGGEVGLWGHFIALADSFLKDKGIFGAVLPVNVLRGRESEKVRKILFEEWTPLYILKPTRNYGFSEWAEYRDVLFIARKGKPSTDHQVKFCLVKQDLTKLTEADVAHIAKQVKTQTKLRGDQLVDIDSHPISELQKRSGNLMWFVGGTDLNSRDILIAFVEKSTEHLGKFPPNCFTEGYRSEGGVAAILYLNRALTDARLEKAFLAFDSEQTHTIKAYSPLGASYTIERNALMPSLRTGVGQTTMDVTASCDYIAIKPYNEVRRVQRAAGIRLANAKQFWTKLLLDTQIASYLVMTTRINPFSPHVHHIAFFGNRKLFPSNQFKTIKVHDISEGKALCVLFNSIIFLAQFLITKEESTGRYVHIQETDLNHILLLPHKPELIASLAQVFDEFRNVGFPALRQQFDVNFDQRYEEYLSLEGGDYQQRLFTVLSTPVQPWDMRLAFDLEVCKAVGIDVTEDELTNLYDIFVKEMMRIKALSRD